MNILLDIASLSATLLVLFFLVSTSQEQLRTGTLLDAADHPVPVRQRVVVFCALGLLLIASLRGLVL